MKNIDPPSGYFYAEVPSGDVGIFASDTQSIECKNLEEASLMAASKGGYVRDARGCRVSDDRASAAKERGLSRLADDHATADSLVARLMRAFAFKH